MTCCGNTKDGSGSGSARPRRCPPIFSKTVLLVIMLTWFLVACLTSYILMKNGYASTNPETQWVLLGALTASSVTFRIRARPSLDRLIVASDSNFQEVVFDAEIASGSTTPDELVVSATATGLSPSTRYYYATTSQQGDDNGSDADLTIAVQGQFTTAPNEGEARNFQFVAASCAFTGSTNQIFETVLQREVLPASSSSSSSTLFFMQMGDFHYEDLNVDSVARRIEAVDTVMSSETQRGLWTTLPMVYMWDDHDWLGNNLGGDPIAVGYEAALKSYRLAFPHYEPLPSDIIAGGNGTQTDQDSEGSGTVGMYQAFTIGTVRFIVTDLRSEATATTIFSSAQRQWLYDQFEGAAGSDEFDFVVWMTTVPWIGTPEEGEDSWLGYPQDRQELSEHIQRVFGAKKNLLAIAGDAHMLAFDDGSNTHYGRVVYNESAADSTAIVRSFPILQSGPLDRLGSAKGGPFSDGCHTVEFERNHQYSVIEFLVEDRDQAPCIKIRSYDQASLVIEKELCGEDIFENSRSNDNPNEVVGSCEAQSFSTANTVLIALSGTMLLVAMALSFLIFEGFLSAFGISMLIFILSALTFAAGVFVPAAAGVPQYDAFETVLICFLAITSVVAYLLAWKCVGLKPSKTDSATDNIETKGDVEE